MSLSPKVYKQVLQFQKDELTDSIVYEYMAKKQKNPKNKETLSSIAKVEREHYAIWKQYTKHDVGPDRKRILLSKILNMFLGETFTIKFFEQGEHLIAQDLHMIEDEIKETSKIIIDGEEHEQALMDMVDEERLHYVGSMVLGLNDALVELTGTIAGLTFALANTRLIALSAIITGVAATLSMAASNYLAQRAEDNAEAVKSSVYTGMAYLITVVIMVLPYLIFPNSMYLVAFGVMLVSVVTIIFLFNYYISVAQDLPFFKRFAEMASISLGVAAISFVIGLLAKNLLGVDI